MLLLYIRDDLPNVCFLYQYSFQSPLKVLRGFLNEINFVCILFQEDKGCVWAFLNDLCWPYVETNQTGLHFRSFPVGRQTETGTLIPHYLAISVLLKTCIILHRQCCSTTTLGIYHLAVPITSFVKLFKLLICIRM